MEMSNLGQNSVKSCFSSAGQNPSSAFQYWSEVAARTKDKCKSHLQPFSWASPETSTLIHQPDWPITGGWEPGEMQHERLILHHQCEQGLWCPVIGGRRRETQTPQHASLTAWRALKVRDSSCSISKGPFPNLTWGFMAANHPSALSSSESRLAKQGLSTICIFKRCPAVPAVSYSKSFCRGSPLRPKCSDHLVQLVSLSRHICEKCRELRVVQWKFLRFLVRQTHKELGLGQRRRQEFGRYLFCRNKSFLLILSSLHLQEGYSTHGWGLANGSWTSPCHAQHSQLEPTLPMHATTCHAGDALPCFQTSRLWKTVEWQLMETRTSFSCRLLRLRSNRDKGG
ncbi:uncharacterized protein LOC121092466 isoform X3 [Falco naumanni]|uniref:uncharacterized protein LOC121092466 isoform X3 n=1 Tax=Falco naumanni TaxID=148594 RepID=UPI001ADEA5F2|nr:uncharacterized protein LOC121092466 isoform X3 [Falco naumanni]